MFMETNKYFQSIFTSILYICGFLLFLEWLYPMQMFSDFLPLYVIIIYASFCFLISLFRMNLWLSIGCKGLGLLFLIDQLFLRTSLLKKKGVLELYKEMVFNVQAILRLDWYHLTMMFRMIMVLLLIWLMSYLIFHWFVVMQRIFVFIFLTFVYVAVLDTFTIYDGTGAIIRTFIIAFISFGLVNLLRIFTQDSREALSWMRMIGSALSIMIVVFLSAVVGYASPTYGPQWPDPIEIGRASCRERE